MPPRRRFESNVIRRTLPEERRVLRRLADGELVRRLSGDLIRTAYFIGDDPLPDRIARNLQEHSLIGDSGSEPSRAPGATWTRFTLTDRGRRSLETGLIERAGPSGGGGGGAAGGR